MHLYDKDEIWGIRVKNAQEYGSLQRDIGFLFVLVAIIFSIKIIDIMQNQVISFGDYAVTLLLLMMILATVHKYIVRGALYRVNKFYHRFYNCEIQTKEIILSPEILYNVMYKTKKVRLREDESMEYYIKVIYDFCSRDLSYAHSLLENLLSLSTKSSVEIEEKGILYRLSYVEKNRGIKYSGFLGLEELK